MSTFSRHWERDLKSKLVKSMRQEPNPKGSGKIHPKIRFEDIFPNRKPGEGGFDMSGGKKRNQNADSDDE